MPCDGVRGKAPSRSQRRAVKSRSGRRLSICGLRRSRSSPIASAQTAAFAWFSSAALLFVVFFSVYAAVRPPTLPDDPSHRAPISAMTRYSFADFLNAAR
ncbi:MAG: hypothetical protein IAI49_09215 [Candidatus Eremiobacteraeota bacterium]|nr:hypothetical protein [Candidatus Eremiobacteraeota bacterium]